MDPLHIEFHRIRITSLDSFGAPLIMSPVLSTESPDGTYATACRSWEEHDTMECLDQENVSGEKSVPDALRQTVTLRNLPSAVAAAIVESSHGMRMETWQVVTFNGLEVVSYNSYHKFVFDYLTSTEFVGFICRNPNLAADTGCVRDPKLASKNAIHQAPDVADQKSIDDWLKLMYEKFSEM